MNFKYTLLDAFTRMPFSGAQIAVFTHADAISEQHKLLLARELNLSETVFVTQSPKPRCDARLEIYSATGKARFAGHAVLAACYAMADAGVVRASDARVLLDDQQIDVIMSIKNQKVQISLPVAESYDEYVPSSGELAQLTGLEQSDIGYKEYRPMIASNTEPYLIVPLKNYKALRAAQFNENRWQLSFVAPLARQILLFTGEHPFEGVNFAARIIGKGVGPQEDPPIGAAAPALGLYLAYGRNDYHRSCKVQRGDEKSRISILEVNVDKKGPDVMGLQLGGHVVKMGEGYIDIPG